MKKNILKDLIQKKASYWESVLKIEKKNTYNCAIEFVPAYKKFLKKEGYKITKKDISDDNFKLLPVMSKMNYLKKFPLTELLINGRLDQPFVLTSTSGSTGTPFYFPRIQKIDQDYSYIIERFLSEGGVDKNKSTLVLVCFGMGVWIGGVITYQAFTEASRRSNLPVSILTPGINKIEIIKALKTIAPNYKNLIIVGYPPFIKDVVDEAISEKINFAHYNTRFIFAAEVFTESFRDYICKKARVKNLYRDTLAIYGSADIGAMAWETGILILVKRLLLKKDGAVENFFGSKHAMPTIGYFNPNWIQFEEQDGKILISGKNAIPFIRYGIGDRGGVLGFSSIVSRLSGCDINFYEEIKKVGLDDAVIELPCVYVYERDDLSTTLYGLQIYPEVIREVLLNTNLSNFLSGKFTMITKFDKQQNQYLQIVLEKNKGINSLSKQQKDFVQKQIIKSLHRNNSEFNELVKHIGRRAYPKLLFLSNEHPEYFKVGVKQKWVRK